MHLSLNIEQMAIKLKDNLRKKCYGYILVNVFFLRHKWTSKTGWRHHMNKFCM